MTLVEWKTETTTKTVISVQLNLASGRASDPWNKAQLISQTSLTASWGRPWTHRKSGTLVWFFCLFPRFRRRFSCPRDLLSVLLWIHFHANTLSSSQNHAHHRSLKAQEASYAAVFDHFECSECKSTTYRCRPTEDQSLKKLTDVLGISWFLSLKKKTKLLSSYECFQSYSPLKNMGWVQYF